ncbi:MAG: stage III sporulation protein AA [Clostridia bacterium]|nr:stage III sporulation protein AA [Clostridia bacterium]
MYILSEKSLEKDRFLSCLTPRLNHTMKDVPKENLLEIRIRKKKPVMLKYLKDTCYLKKEGGICKDLNDAYIIDGYEIASLAESIFESSLYAHEEEIAEGFVTIKGGHRIGLCGEARKGEIRALSDITSMNFRIAHEHIGIAEPIIPHILENGNIKNTLIISPPMSGKTSLLRDIARLLSENGTKVSLCDTRGEIAAVYDGEACMDIGFSDVLSGINKADGMKMLLRTMSPDVIISDELGTKEDIGAVMEILGSGSKIIASVHKESREMLYKSPVFGEILPYIDLIITLGGIGEIREVYHV